METFTLSCFWEQVKFSQLLTMTLSNLHHFSEIHVCLYLVDDGWLHRAVEVDGEMHIIEELQIFANPQPVESMVISSVQVFTDKVLRVCAKVMCHSLFLPIFLLEAIITFFCHFKEIFNCSFQGFLKVCI